MSMSISEFINYVVINPLKYLTGSTLIAGLLLLSFILIVMAMSGVPVQLLFVLSLFAVAIITYYGFGSSVWFFITLVILGLLAGIAIYRVFR